MFCGRPAPHMRSPRVRYMKKVKQRRINRFSSAYSFLIPKGIFSVMDLNVCADFKATLPVLPRSHLPQPTCFHKECILLLKPKSQRRTLLAFVDFPLPCHLWLDLPSSFSAGFHSPMFFPPLLKDGFSPSSLQFRIFSPTLLWEDVGFPGCSF